MKLTQTIHLSKEEKIASYTARIKQAKQALQNAPFVLIGAGAGLSDAAGLHYTGPRFTTNFAPFIQKYDFQDLYTSSFYPFETEEERWAYWAKHICVNRYDPPATNLYKELFRLVNGKDYFVLTTNVEYQFHKAGFVGKNVFMVQGNYGYFQCEKGCHQKLYSNEKQVKAMIAHTRDCKIPASLVPKCPLCGGKMDVNVHHNPYFVRDEHWNTAENQYQAFLQRSHNKPVLLLELGVGFNTPGIIRYPFEQLTYQNSHATLLRINRDFPNGVPENETRTIAFTEELPEIVRQLIPR